MKRSLISGPALAAAMFIQAQAGEASLADATPDRFFSLIPRAYLRELSADQPEKAKETPLVRLAETRSDDPDKSVATALSEGPIQKSKPDRNVAGIQDNSFLIEEAYNQEAGVMQHILNTVYGVNRLPGPDDKSLDLIFTQEWPIFSQTHQFSYTIPYSFVETGRQSDNGIGDILLNYRYQAYFNEDKLRAFAPRFSLVLPTGDATLGLGDNTLGFQWNLPFSTALGDRWFAHANAGLTYLPNAGVKPTHDLTHYNLGASAIYAATPSIHFMLEWLGLWNQEFEAGVGRHREFASVVSPGLRRAFNFADDSQLVLGIGAPIGLTRSAPDFGVFLYLSFEHGLVKRK